MRFLSVCVCNRIVVGKTTLVRRKSLWFYGSNVDASQRKSHRSRCRESSMPLREIPESSFCFERDWLVGQCSQNGKSWLDRCGRERGFHFDKPACHQPSGERWYKCDHGCRPHRILERRDRLCCGSNCINNRVSNCIIQQKWKASRTSARRLWDPQSFFGRSITCSQSWDRSHHTQLWLGTTTPIVEWSEFAVLFQSSWNNIA